MQEKEEQKTDVLERLNKIENVVESIKDYLKMFAPKEQKPQDKTIHRAKFEHIYNLTKYEVPRQMPLKPLGIWFDVKYKNSMLENLVEPMHEDSEIYFPIGDYEPLPILFKELDSDYWVDFRHVGTL